MDGTSEQIGITWPFIALFALVLLVTALCIAASVSAGRQPKEAFVAAHQPKLLWVLLPLITFIGWAPLGIPGAIVWFAFIRRRVVAGGRQSSIAP
jgi:hypothetical protein